MPCDYSEFPENWLTEIRPAILDRAKHRCELCGVDNYAEGARDKDGRFYSAFHIHLMFPDELARLFPGGPQFIRIILTVAHMDHNRHNNNPGNLRALCQRCHLNYDRKRNLRTRKQNRIKKVRQAKRETGFQELPGMFDEPLTD